MSAKQKINKGPVAKCPSQRRAGPPKAGRPTKGGQAYLATNPENKISPAIPPYGAFGGIKTTKLPLKKTRNHVDRELSLNVNNQVKWLKRPKILWNIDKYK